MENKQKDSCDVYCFDEEKVSRVRQRLEAHDTLDIVKVFKALADDTRLKVAYALCQEEELCVCDVANILSSSTATASHHLRLLRNMGLAKYRKDGKLVFYSLLDANLKQLIMFAFAQQKEAMIR